MVFKADTRTFDECVQKTEHDLITPNVGYCRGEQISLEPGSCWKWVGQTHLPGNKKNKQPRGRFRLNGKMMIAPRVAFFLKHGFLSQGLQVCHKCNNSLCVNPDHLYEGTNKDNVQDCKASGRFRAFYDKEKSETQRRCKISTSYMNKRASLTTLDDINLLLKGEGYQPGRSAGTIRSWQTRRERYGKSGFKNA